MAVPPRTKLRTAYKKARSIAPLHTSGPVAITPDGSKLITCVGEDAILTDIILGVQICLFSGDTQSITSLCITPSATHLLLFTSAPSLRIYEIPRTSSPLQKNVQPIRVVARAHDAPVHACIADPTSTYLASGSADGVVKVWDIMRGYITHVFKGHGGVVSALAFNYPRDPSAITQKRTMQLVTASVDTRIRIFDLTSNTKTESSSRPIAVLEGHVSVPRGLDVSLDGKWLVSGGRDSVVLIWDLSSGSAASTTQPSDGKQRGKEKGKAKEFSVALHKTIPILERVEAVGLLHPDEALAGPSSEANSLYFYTAGEKGVVKIWDGHGSKVLFGLGEESEHDGDQEEQRQIVDAMYVPATSTVISVHADQNIMFHSLTSRRLIRQLIGFNDEIVDAAFLSPRAQSDVHASSKKSSEPSTKDTHIALATNSSLIRVYSTTGIDARLLSGHTEIVLCLDRSPEGHVIASGSKDRSARIWAPLRSDLNSSGSTDSQGGLEWGCVALCEGHTESVGAIAMSRKTDEDGDNQLRFMFTGSQDRMIKMWDLSSVPQVYEGHEPLKCKSLTTQKAHDKDINSLDVAPNDKLLASGSQDRTAKIYEIDFSGSGSKVRGGGIKLLGTCKGHKRGVWNVRFGRTERVLATGSGDKTVKLWNLDDFSCVKTFEGHTNSVLRVDFINSGMHLLSAASDGLVKLWNVREEECIATMDNHEDKVWALTISSDERTIVSGGADSVVTFWQDCTEEQEQEKEAKRADMVLKEQDFMNYLALHDYRRAIELALAMQQPGRLFSLFSTIQSSSQAEDDEEMTQIESVTGSPAVDEVIRTLSGPDLVQLLRYIRDWNANARTSGVAQGVLYAVMKLRSGDEVMQAFGNESNGIILGDVSSTGDLDINGTSKMALKELIDGLIPYTERHLSRMERLLQESFVVDFVLNEMDDGMLDGADDDGRMDIDANTSVQT